MSSPTKRFEQVEVDRPIGADVADALARVEQFVRRFVVLSDAQLAAIALWTLHTHALEATDTTPYLAITSAEKRSGKTRLLEVLALLVWKPLQTANISDAALFRAIAQYEPTLLFDEIDAVFGSKAREREDLRGMLNIGYQRGAVVYRMGGRNFTTLEEFAVYCPKAFAGIGELPDTLADRSIRIRLERRLREEPIERFRRRYVVPEAAPIYDLLAASGARHLERLANARPSLPDELDDRAQDCWEPLLAIADLAGDEWPERARAAALELSTGENREDESIGARLLSDIASVFEENEADRYRSADLCAELAAIEESPWGEWYGKKISPQSLGNLLKRHRIKTKPIRIDGQKCNGYERGAFAEAWARVLGGTGGTGGTSKAWSDAGCTTRTTRTTHHADEALSLLELGDEHDDDDLAGLDRYVCSTCDRREPVKVAAGVAYCSCGSMMRELDHQDDALA